MPDRRSCSLDDLGVHRAAVLEGVGDLVEDVSRGGEGTSDQAGQDRIALAGQPLRDTYEDHHLAPDSFGFAEQNAVGLDTGAVVVSQAVECLPNGGESGAGGRTGLAALGEPGGCGQFPVQRCKRHAFGTVAPQRPGSNGEQGLSHAAGEHEERNVRRGGGRLREVAEDERSRDRGNADLGCTGAGGQQQASPESKHEKQQHRGHIDSRCYDGEAARHCGGRRGAEHPQHSQPVGAGTIGKRGLQCPDSGGKPQR